MKRWSARAGRTRLRADRRRPDWDRLRRGDRHRGQPGRGAVSTAVLYQRLPTVIYGLADQGVDAPADLAGKRVGVHPDSTTRHEFAALPLVRSGQGPAGKRPSSSRARRVRRRWIRSERHRVALGVRRHPRSDRGADRGDRGGIPRRVRRTGPRPPGSSSTCFPGRMHGTSRRAGRGCAPSWATRSETRPPPAGRPPSIPARSGSRHAALASPAGANSVAAVAAMLTAVAFIRS